MTGFGDAVVKSEGRPVKFDAASASNSAAQETFYLEIAGTKEEWASLRHALTERKAEFVRKIALAAADLSKGKLV